jgi:hypothetical protein
MRIIPSSAAPFSAMVLFSLLPVPNTARANFAAVQPSNLACTPPYCSLVMVLSSSCSSFAWDRPWLVVPPWKQVCRLRRLGLDGAAAVT